MEHADSCEPISGDAACTSRLPSTLGPMTDPSPGGACGRRHKACQLVYGWWRGVGSTKRSMRAFCFGQHSVITSRLIRVLPTKARAWLKLIAAPPQGNGLAACIMVEETIQQRGHHSVPAYTGDGKANPFHL